MNTKKKCNLINNLILNGVITFSNELVVTTCVGQSMKIQFIVSSYSYIPRDTMEILYGEVYRVVLLFGNPSYYVSRQRLDILELTNKNKEWNNRIY